MAEVSRSKAFISIGIEIQKEEIQVLEDYLTEMDQLKKEYVNRNLENEANLTYCLASGLRVIQYELMMLVHIKKDKMHEAWGNLVNAETMMGTVISNLPFDPAPLESYLQRLGTYEQLLFPKMLFQSVGGIVRKSHCSICKKDFRDCDHEKGKLYMGELCCRVIEEMDLEEVSCVDNPASKHARAISITVEGKDMDLLTHRKVVKKDNVEPSN